MVVLALHKVLLNVIVTYYLVDCSILCDTYLIYIYCDVCFGRNNIFMQNRQFAGKFEF